MNEPRKPDDNPPDEGFIARAQKRDKWFPISMLVVASVGVLSRTTTPIGLDLDSITFGAFMLLIAWLLWPKSTKDTPPDH